MFNLIITLFLVVQTGWSSQEKSVFLEACKSPNSQANITLSNKSKDIYCRCSLDYIMDISTDSPPDIDFYSTEKANEISISCNAKALVNEIYGKSESHLESEIDQYLANSDQRPFPPIFIITLSFFPAAYYRLYKKNRIPLPYSLVISGILSLISLSGLFVFISGTGVLFSLQAKLVLISSVFLISLIMMQIPNLNPKQNFSNNHNSEQYLAFKKSKTISVLMRIIGFCLISLAVISFVWLTILFNAPLLIGYILGYYSVSVLFTLIGIFLIVKA